MGPIDANKLWQNFMDTVQNHYMDFGRVPRAQYWFFILVCVGVDIVAAILDAVVRTGLLGAVVGLALLLPMGGMTARRMQDTGRSGQMVWIWIIATAIFQVFALQGSSLGGLLGGLCRSSVSLFGLAGLISLLGLGPARDRYRASSTSAPSLNSRLTPSMAPPPAWTLRPLHAVSGPGSGIFWGPCPRGPVS